MLGFIGAGKMAEALVGGLIAGGVFEPSQIAVSDVNPLRLEFMQERFKIGVFKDNGRLVEGADAIVLAVKPKDVDEVLRGIAGKVGEERLLISIAAGVPTPRLLAPFSHPPRLIRVMPNACVFAGAGASVIYLTSRAKEEDRELTLKIFGSVGRAFVVDDEHLLDAVTALSGSGPAYFFLIMEALSDAGVAQGLPRELARELSLMTAYGSAKMALESKEHLAVLKDMITSPGGTTIAALEKMERAGLRGIIMEAIDYATRRSEELGRKEG